MFLRFLFDLFRWLWRGLFDAKYPTGTVPPVQFDDTLREAWDEAKHDIAEALERCIKRSVPVRTGRLRRSIRVNVEGEDIVVRYIFYLPPVQAKRGRDYIGECLDSTEVQRVIRRAVNRASSILP